MKRAALAALAVLAIPTAAHASTPGTGASVSVSVTIVAVLTIETVNGQPACLSKRRRLFSRDCGRRGRCLVGKPDAVAVFGPKRIRS